MSKQSGVDGESGHLFLREINWEILASFVDIRNNMPDNYPKLNRSLREIMTTVSKRIKDLVDARIKQDVDKINRHFKKSFIAPNAVYDVNGGNAGYVTSRDGHRNLHLNPSYFINDEDEMINCTTPHELAHWAEYKVYGGWERIGRKRSVHGRRWKMIMHLLGVDDSRTHQMDTTHVARKTKNKYDYECGSCHKHHTISAVIHTRIASGRLASIDVGVAAH